MKATTPKLTLGKRRTDFYASGVEWVCARALRQYWELPRGTKEVWVEVSTRPSAESHAFVFRRGWCMVCYGRTETTEGLWDAAEKWLIAIFLRTPHSDETLHVRVLYKETDHE